MTTAKLDLSGLKCPLPALKTRKALKGIMPGGRLEVTCTDPMAAIDIPHLLTETGDRLEKTDRDGATIVFVIEKASAASPG
ncbi:MAG: sulfurtransferase TusA family protein [Alphaproteobacteria bacterium]|jgi:tRNA 2-thiouridine synthesizing protein A|nr:sulfurtransferase TusA family protein [Alphaproteobacteria bacterium]MBU0806138.1 sulfurtransferase TusA family protein [Alphaproteobacteria bacterium]MBU0871296.1 sulfurtransferase TusA family protein [Alphaproteobacteria bacterium]MBU1400446.1 sulfurtransferase TusA family protein [Alphaproteobacteria bacterium]MBU1591549.1 sulfurtransferase TusA family protein [Alphaproteobacteria bacterium]